MLWRAGRWWPDRAARTASAWWLPAAAVVALATGALPPDGARDVLARIAPVLGFLAAVTVVAELADAAGLFESAAGMAIRAGRGRVPLLWLLVVGLATLTTALLSLDTTAVLLTPVVLALAGRLSLPPLPFALATVWLANTASLFLPVSNLTNLLAVERSGWSGAGWAARMWLPALVSTAVTVAVLGVLGRRDLGGRYRIEPAAPATHRGLLRVAGLACLGLGVAVGAGVAPWLAATAAAAVLVAGFGAVDRDRLTRDLLPGRLLLGTVALFLVVAAAERHGLSAALARAAGGADDGLPGLLRTAGVGAVTANAVNNLPAYLALEPATGAHPASLLALVIGVNVGPLVTPWGSLATLLWRQRCAARGVRIGSLRLAGYGALLVVPALLLTVATLSWLTP